jgi:carboxypeptidase T
MKKTTLLLLLACYFFALTAQEKYSRVKLFLDDKNTIEKLLSLGIAADHGEVKKGAWIITDLSEIEINSAKQNGFSAEILIEDVALFYEMQNQMPNKNENRSGICNGSSLNVVTPSNFALGSMGGFLTYAEMLQNLDSMASKYPNLITAKQAISTFQTHEGRPIYWVKISDNPNQNENEPEVLYDALHHAREAASLSQLIYYMWYLLENYNSSPEIKYLVDNLEMYFVPCINPDGYIRNQNTNPNGGGMWRKNRRNNGNGTYGVDLNRNYGYNWAYDNTGSSPNTSSETYRGPSAFSEPETQAMKWFCENHEFKLALNYHTYGDLLIYPWGYELSIYTPDSAAFGNFAETMTRDNNYVYGTGDQTVGYVTNGDSDDWMYGEQGTKNKIFSMTPEAGLGSDGFWPNINRIEDICKVNVTQNLWMAHLALKYAKATDAAPSQFTQTNGFLKYNIQRLGLDSPATYTVSITPLQNMLSAGAPKMYSSLSHLQTVLDSISFTLVSNIVPGQTFSYVLSVNNGFYTYRDTITKIFGSGQILLSDNASTMTGWTCCNWNITTQQFYSAPSSITDSPFGNYANNTNKITTLNNTVSIPANALFPKLTFYAKWDIEAGYDFVQVMASNDNGSSWTPLCGLYTKEGNNNQDVGMPLYDGKQLSWVKEEIDLSDYIGHSIKIRFRLISDAGVTADGYYFDDLEISYIEPPSSVQEKSFDEKLVSVYPNPTSEKVNINYLLTENGSLEITDSFGRIIYVQTLNATQQSAKINISDFPAGTYFVSIISQGSRSKVQKLVIIR